RLDRSFVLPLGDVPLGPRDGEVGFTTVQGCIPTRVVEGVHQTVVTGPHVGVVLVVLPVVLPQRAVLGVELHVDVQVFPESDDHLHGVDDVGSEVTGNRQGEADGLAPGAEPHTVGVTFVVTGPVEDLVGQVDVVFGVLLGQFLVVQGTFLAPGA